MTTLIIWLLLQIPVAFLIGSAIKWGDGRD